MNWLLPRLLVAVVAMAAGAAVGWLVGHSFDTPGWGMLTGAAIAIVTVATIDTLRGVRIIAWLQGAQDEDAPRDPGFWGELAYRVERALRQRESATAAEQARLAQFRDAMEASPNGVLMLSAAEQIDWCNSVAAAHFGLDPLRDRHQPVTNLVRAPAFVAYLQAGVFREPVSFESRGATISVLARSYGDGMRLVLSQDVTERERADSMRRDFVANVSHEIRTPLTVLAGFIETMGTLPLTEVERRRVLTLMGEQTLRMQRLVTDLLTLAQLEGSPRPASDRWLPLAPLLRQVEADARSLSAGRHRIALAGASDLQIAGAETELHSALSNLANNAVRYTPTDGRIDIAWRVLADGSGEFSVKDTGPGIEREHLPRLTERFYRVDGSRSRETGGTGLGLSIVKHVVQRHGGELDIQSEPGRGSTFRLVFPAVRLRSVATAQRGRESRDVVEAAETARAEPR
ncbi:MAG TPA: phosphate regulon sensor histidine kinase PhoR [Methylibium sp.]|uniref:phosphate regulon sensor histidine kinase PhoR n=1 Tax=Methylibium sp. TaxID=2067992 RepID=UPI002DBDD1D7|nr:phosphate regulon sensor histidine kinase PhoR [Methylibium sp.]HEU4459042.1 phosphate regulon sensor histidine kinase PhoR [Methylibium sp.]